MVDKKNTKEEMDIEKDKELEKVAKELDENFEEDDDDFEDFEVDGKY